MGFTIEEQDLKFTFAEEAEEQKTADNLGSVEPLKNIVADEGSFKAELKLDRKEQARLHWLFAKIHFKVAFNFLWEIVVLFFRKDGESK